ncbi:hypothetical protein CSB45_05915 [candidate division KSB3 bacterium]|uniref:Cell shape determination protein CcmA n=1 Tax=candidate division KSB3 bacterium TaxID=2044937 RepID=A0A2G6E6P4_9BACT|nr:MAG: hypothetical protein CSB45_05915 [candidate division KSB3 bacterium]PIE30186.1 MAG: hypothetical protein CSA57_04635 [candidate division KSB3 bacterium]
MSVLEEGLVITGDIFGEVDLTVKGVVKGAIFLRNRHVHIDRSGYVEGDVRADTIIISGEIEGNLTAETSLQVKAGARIRGNIRTAKLSMAENAVFSGGLTIQEPEPVELEIQDYKALTEEDYDKLRRWRMRNNVD